MLTCDCCKCDFVVKKEVKIEDNYSSRRKSFSKDKVDNGTKPLNNHKNSDISTIDAATLIRAFFIIIGVGMFLVSGNLIAGIVIAIFIIFVICITK